MLKIPTRLADSQNKSMIIITLLVEVFRDGFIMISWLLVLHFLFKKYKRIRQNNFSYISLDSFRGNQYLIL